MFYSVDHEVLDEYDRGFELAKLFQTNDKGITTSRDHLAVAFDKADLSNRLLQFTDPNRSDEEIRAEFWPKKKKRKGLLPGDTASWSMAEARTKLRSVEENVMQPISYRPFDWRAVCYSPAMLERPRPETMRHVIARENIALSTNRGVEEDRPFSDSFVVDRAIQLHSLSIKEANNLAPLYLYPDEQDLDQSIQINFHPKLYAKIRLAAGLTGKVPAADTAMVESGAFRTANGDDRPDEVKVFDYIYGVLHCPAYRATFAEFLKIDFPRIPFPPSPEVFRKVSEQGEALRRLHLMEDAAIGEAKFPYEGEGDSIVDKPRFEGGKVWINNDQGFAGVPALAWDFPIGGYQPAQKWLKDRKGRALTYDDIRHYQKIIKILAETDRIMREIDLPLG